MLQTVIYKGLYGIDRFFLKEIKNVMFLNKIDVPYCLVVFLRYVAVFNMWEVGASVQYGD